MNESDAFHLLVAVGLTFVLGFERDMRGALAGDRVFALVGAGGGVVGIIAAHGAATLLSGAITGIGFIGGGLLFREADGAQQVVRGMTTAAAIFASAAIGAAAGTGRLLIAAEGTALALFVLEIRHVRLLRFFDGRRWARYFREDDKPVQHLWHNFTDIPAYLEQQIQQVQENQHPLANHQDPPPQPSQPDTPQPDAPQPVTQPQHDTAPVPDSPAGETPVHG